ncbi:MAG: ATP-binding protein [Coriobacteriia bacterium]|nr:ATP-binding protein [Coriobacteriia bacterium]
MANISLKIAAFARNPEQRNSVAGSLFEQMMARVVAALGYELTAPATTRILSAGVEIDIHARHRLTCKPIVVECKFYAAPVEAGLLKKFFGVFMAEHLADSTVEGLFVAVPGLNSAASGFFRDKITPVEDSFKCMQEAEVIRTILETERLASPPAFEQVVRSLGTPGDCLLVGTPTGYVWAQYITSEGELAPTSVAFFDAQGAPLAEEDAARVADELTELSGFEIVGRESLNLGRAKPEQAQPPLAAAPDEQDEIATQPGPIVEVVTAATQFEYQRPASPKDFIGRQPELERIAGYVSQLARGGAASHGILVQGSSGIGKSSFVVAAANRFREDGHVALALDCRTATGPRFFLDAMAYAIDETAERLGIEPAARPVVTGYEGVHTALDSIGRVLTSQNKALVVILDQFENLFTVRGALDPIVATLVWLGGSAQPVALGFSWKADFVGFTEGFPFIQRDLIMSSSERLQIDLFNDPESDGLINALEHVIPGHRLNTELRFLLKEFGQGLPWLLKKLCAHVKQQLHHGLQQREISRRVLNVQGLFDDDLRDLAPEQRVVLNRIAASAPVTYEELGDVEPAMLRSLLDRRLIVQVGNRYDIYWDIFRDYLNRGTLPVLENYLLRQRPTTVTSVYRLIAARDSERVTPEEVMQGAELKEGSFYNVQKEMQLLGLVEIDNRGLSPLVPLPQDEDEALLVLREHLYEKLPRNRTVSIVLDELAAAGSLSMRELAGVMETASPYLTATQRTWENYARCLAGWLHLAGLADYAHKRSRISSLDEGETGKSLLLVGRRGKSKHSIPEIQYSPILEVARRIAVGLTNRTKIDYADIPDRTREKALAALEGFGWIARTETGKLRVSRRLVEFAENPDAREAMFREGALMREPFRVFVGALEERADAGASLLELGSVVREELHTNWSDSTTVLAAKIMLDWARAAGLAHGVFSSVRRGGYRGESE